MDKSWLKNLKKGDPVFVDGTLTVVDHITPTGIIVVDGTKYNPHTGWSKGSDVWYHSFLIEATSDKIKAYTENVYVKNINKYIRDHDLTYDEAVKIAEILGVK